MIIEFEYDGIKYRAELSENDERANLIREQIMPGQYSIPGGSPEELGIIPVYIGTEFSHWRDSEGHEYDEQGLIDLGLHPDDYI